MNIAILGFGVMARAVAERLAELEVQVSVFARTPSKARSCPSTRLLICDSAEVAVRDAAIVFSFVTDDEASQEVWFGRKGALKSLPKEAFCFECSTLSVEYIDGWLARIRRRSPNSFDLPVTGSRKGARAGTLTGFLGGPVLALSPILPLLRHLFANIVELTIPGHGMRLKLSYNLMSGIILGGLVEGLALAEAWGLERKRALGVFKTVGVGQRIATIKERELMDMRFHDRGQDIFCSMANFRKDLRYAYDASRKKGKELRLAKTLCDLYASLAECSRELDYSSVSLLYNCEEGVTGPLGGSKSRKGLPAGALLGEA